MSARGTLAMVRLFARQELVLAVRSRWTPIFAVVFAALSLGVAFSGYILTGGFGMQDFARTAVSLPETARGWRPWIRVDVNHQDDVYERQINGARFGERTLLDARTGLTLGHWSLEAWGTNLTDESYVRASFSRLPIFYPTQPRPLDIIFPEGRRYGVTVRWSF